MAYWLFKTEPHVFSFADLSASPRPACWDGVRNAEARNHLRDRVRLDDEVFIYHSSTKSPHIAGIARVVREAFADPSAFDPNSTGFDPKSSREAPRWFAVELVAVRALCPVTLTRLRAEAALATMTLLRRPRLSVQPVEAAEWQAVLRLAAE